MGDIPNLLEKLKTASSPSDSVGARAPSVLYLNLGRDLVHDLGFQVHAAIDRHAWLYSRWRRQQAMFDQIAATDPAIVYGLLSVGTVFNARSGIGVAKVGTLQVLDRALHELEIEQ